MDNRNIQLDLPEEVARLLDSSQCDLSRRIPAAVQQEVSRELGGDLPPCLRIRAVSDTQLTATLGLHLDRGEAEAITLAIELGMPLLIDEKDGRKGCSDRAASAWLARLAF
jgi:hypothetical protein